MAHLWKKGGNWFRKNSQITGEGTPCLGRSIRRTQGNNSSQKKKGGKKGKIAKERGKEGRVSLFGERASPPRDQP